MMNNGKQKTLPYKHTKLWFVSIAFLASIGLWLYSSGIYYRPLEPLTFAARGPGALLQLCSQQRALHLLVMRNRFGNRPSIHFERQTYLGNAGYHHGLGFNLGGFELRVLHHTYNGGDYLISPYAAIVVPYWFTTAGLALLVLAYSGLHRRLAPYLRFSRYSLPFMAAIAIVFLYLQIFPTATYYDGVLKDYGFPQTYLRVAVQDGQTLDFFMGYALGWRQIKLMENFLFAVVAILAVGLLCEFFHHRFRSAQPKTARLRK